MSMRHHMLPLLKIVFALLFKNKRVRSTQKTYERAHHTHVLKYK